MDKLDSRTVPPDSVNPAGRLYLRRLADGGVVVGFIDPLTGASSVSQTLTAQEWEGALKFLAPAITPPTDFSLGGAVITPTVIPTPAAPPGQLAITWTAGPTPDGVETLG